MSNQDLEARSPLPHGCPSGYAWVRCEPDSPHFLLPSPTPLLVRCLSLALSSRSNTHSYSASFSLSSSVTVSKGIEAGGAWMHVHWIWSKRKWGETIALISASNFYASGKLTDQATDNTLFHDTMSATAAWLPFDPLWIDQAQHWLRLKPRFLTVWIGFFSGHSNMLHDNPLNAGLL